MDYLGFEHCCHEGFDFVLGVDDGFDGLGAFLCEFVDSFAFDPCSFD